MGIPYNNLIGALSGKPPNTIVQVVSNTVASCFCSFISQPSLRSSGGDGQQGGRPFSKCVQINALH